MTSFLVFCSLSTCIDHPLDQWQCARTPRPDTHEPIQAGRGRGPKSAPPYPSALPTHLRPCPPQPLGGVQLVVMKRRRGGIRGAAAQMAHTTNTSTSATAANTAAVMPTGRKILRVRSMMAS